MLGKHDPASPLEYYPPLENPLFPQYQAEAAYLYDMLRLTYSCIQQPMSGAFNNPTLPSEDLARGWDQTYLALFLQRLNACIVNLWNGIVSHTEADAIQHYKRALGGTFPP